MQLHAFVHQPHQTHTQTIHPKYNKIYVYHLHDIHLTYYTLSPLIIPPYDRLVTMCDKLIIPRWQLLSVVIESAA